MSAEYFSIELFPVHITERKSWIVLIEFWLSFSGTGQNFSNIYLKAIRAIYSIYVIAFSMRNYHKGITSLFYITYLYTAPRYEWKEADDYETQTHTYTTFSPTHPDFVSFHYTLLFPSPVLFSDVIGKAVKAFWETWPCSQRKASRQKTLKCISFTFFVFLQRQFIAGWGSATHGSGGGHSSSHIALRSLPTSAPDGHLIGKLKFNADESWLTSWEINVTHQRGVLLQHRVEKFRCLKSPLRGGCLFGWQLRLAELIGCVSFAGAWG